ncbi:MAG: hypothetical protein M1816_005587 [Peltula sp. TS41687]|nr:MAG: hypothetical protein M1816_005587 [Peltula sp. TS41687]
MQQVLDSVSDGLALLCLPLAPLRQKRRQDGSSPITLGIPRAPVKINTTASQPWRESSPEEGSDEISSESSEESLANQEPSIYDPNLTLETTIGGPANTMATGHTHGADNLYVPSPHLQARLKIPDPDRFKGEPAKAKTFIGQVQAKLDGTGPLTDAARISYATALLSDRAVEWLGSYMSLEGRHTFQSYQDFLTKFKQQFIDPNPRATAMKKLMDTKQGTDDIQTYLMEVTPLVNDSDIGVIAFAKELVKSFAASKTKHSTIRYTRLYEARRPMPTRLPDSTPSPDTPLTATLGTTAPAQWTSDGFEAPYQTTRKHDAAAKGYVYTAEKQDTWHVTAAPQARKDEEGLQRAHNSSTQSPGQTTPAALKTLREKTKARHDGHLPAPR